MNIPKLIVNWLVLPLIGLAALVAVWAVLSSMTINPRTNKANLPSPARTWQQSETYVLEPFAHRGEMDQGIGRLTLLSLWLVAKGYALALLIGAPLGFILGSSKLFRHAFDPIMQ